MNIYLTQKDGLGGNKIKVMNFEELYWHDSVIRNIEIDRRDPGNIDTICFEIDWYDIGVNKLIFEDVYWARFTMNFGVVAEESIDDAFIASEDDVDVIKVRNIWGKYLSEKLYCFVIKTASTGSEIKIIAKKFKII